MKTKQIKQIKRIKLIKDYRREVRELMDKHNVFLTSLRVHKLAFMLSYAKLKEQKQWIKWFKKLSPEALSKYLDNRIPPFFCWHEGEIE